MQWSDRLLVQLVILAVLSTGAAGNAVAEITGKGSQVSIRFPAFSLSPGERISGVKVTTSAGHLSAGCRPNRWSCDHTGNTIHCYSMHPSYATGISGMLPEIFIRNASSSFSVVATVEFINGDGKEYSKEFRESDLIVK